MNVKMKKLVLCMSAMMMLTGGAYGSFKLDDRIIIDLQKVESSYNSNVSKAYQQVAKSLNALNTLKVEGKNDQEQLRAVNQQMENISKSIETIDGLIIASEKDMEGVYRRLLKAKSENVNNKGVMKPLEYEGRKIQIAEINKIIETMQGGREKPIDPKLGEILGNINRSSQVSTELSHHRFHAYSLGLVGKDLRRSTDLMYLQLTELKANRMILSAQLQSLGKALALRQRGGMKIYSVPATRASIDGFYKTLEGVRGQRNTEAEAPSSEDMYKTWN